MVMQAVKMNFVFAAAGALIAAEPVGNYLSHLINPVCPTLLSYVCELDIGVAVFHLK